MTTTARFVVHLLFLASGAMALVYQVAWMRNLSLIFGASHQAISIVLGSFMAGLALGGYYFGRRDSTIRRPLRLYGFLELGVAMTALALPVLLRIADGVYVSAARRVGEVTPALTLLRIILAFGALVLPTFFMGGTLPVLTQFLVRQMNELGARLSGLYAINTFGAVLGVVAAGFVLLPRLGVWNTQLVAVAVTSAVGTLAMIVDRRLALNASSAITPPAENPVSVHKSADLPHNAGTLALRLAFWGTAVSGACALALEVMWTRAISTVTGATTYGFTIMLAAFLSGIALGSLVHAVAPWRRASVSVQFGVALAAIGVSSLVVTYMIPRLPEWSLSMDYRLYGGVTGLRPANTLVLSFLVMLVPCVFMGMAFPLAGQARAALIQRVGKSVGDVAAVNTIGAIFGSLAAGFLLIPVIGLHRGLLVVSAINLGYGLIVLCAALGGLKPRLRPVATLGGFAGAAIIVLIPLGLPNWNAGVLARYQNNNPTAFLDRQGRPDIDARLEEITIAYFKEGRGATVAVLEYNGLRSLVINGKCVATDTESDLHHELMLGHLPMLLHPDPRSAIVIGLGAGITLGGVAAQPEVEDITLVEIEEAVYGAAEMFNHVHGNAMADPRVRRVVQDGRNYLLTCPRTFDVITADPIDP